ncbi:Flp pilus assembly protein CpaB [Tessaracoccus sp. G1721]
MTRRLIAAIAATILTVIAGILVASYVVGADQRAVAKLEPTAVLVVTQDVPAGSPITMGENVETREIPLAAVVPGALTTPEPVAGQVAAAALHPGEQLLPDRFVAPEDLTGDQVVVPEELVQVTVSLGPERVIGGRLAAGDTVGVVLSVTEPAASTETILHRVLVTRVQDAEQGSGEAEEGEDVTPPGAQYITLAVSAPDAERVVWSAEHGTIWLTLERDTSVVDGTRQVTLENVAS